MDNPVKTEETVSVTKLGDSHCDVLDTLYSAVETENNEGAEAITNKEEPSPASEPSRQEGIVKDETKCGLSKESTVEEDFKDAIDAIVHKKLSRVHEGMVITMGYLHCILSLNVLAALCLTVFLWLKTLHVPKFLLMFFFTFLAIFCPAVITEVTLLMLEPPLDICENLSDHFRNTAQLANNNLGLIAAVKRDSSSKKID